MMAITQDEAAMEEILAQLTPVFRDVLDNRTLVLTPETTARDVEGWDSFTHARLIAAVEDRYAISFGLKEILGFRNVGEICRAVLRSAR